MTIDKLWRLAGELDLLPRRVRTLVTSAVTVLMAVAAAAQVFVEAVGDDWPDGVRVAARVGAVAAAAALAVRRVTPVPPEERGLLPTGADRDPTDEPADV
ncbi:MAG: hypothetical protein D6683_07270 [Actinomyces sp.]|nr:MAG: hypothetical protein D6683_07270 [Actinomyces sp.]